MQLEAVLCRRGRDHSRSVRGARGPCERVGRNGRELRVPQVDNEDHAHAADQTVGRIGAMAMVVIGAALGAPVVGMAGGTAAAGRATARRAAFVTIAPRRASRACPTALPLGVLGARELDRVFKRVVEDYALSRLPLVSDAADAQDRPRPALREQ